MTDVSDAELLVKWRAGDGSAGDALLARSFPLLFRFFRNKVGIDTEDLVQQTLLGCMSYRERMAESANFRAYLLRVARNRLYDYLRAKGRKGDIDPDLGVSSVVDLGSRLSHVAAKNQEHTLLVEAIRRLPVELQVPLELHYWEDLSASEVAEVLELPLGTVKTRLRRSRQLLKESLERTAEPPDLERSIRAARTAVAVAESPT